MKHFAHPENAITNDTYKVIMPAFQRTVQDTVTDAGLKVGCWFKTLSLHFL